MSVLPPDFLPLLAGFSAPVVRRLLDILTLHPTLIPVVRARLLKKMEAFKQKDRQALEEIVTAEEQEVEAALKRLKSYA